MSTFNWTPACQCVGCSSQHAKLKNSQNEYEEIVTNIYQQETNQPY